VTTFIFKHVLTCSSLHRVPQDINLDASAQDAQIGGESPKVNKHVTPGAKKTTPKSSKPQNPSGAQSFLGTGGALSPPLKAAPSLKSTNPEPVESPRTVPLNPQSFGLGSVGSSSQGGDSSGPRAGKSSR
jgi:hypothetical protein